MKAKLAPVSWQELVKRLRALGFEGPFAGGKHLFMLKGALRFTLPNLNLDDQMPIPRARHLQTLPACFTRQLRDGHRLVSYRNVVSTYG